MASVASTALFSNAIREATSTELIAYVASLSPEAQKKLLVALADATESPPRDSNLVEPVGQHEKIDKVDQLHPHVHCQTGLAEDRVSAGTNENKVHLNGAEVEHSPQPRTVALSLDYDGCMDVLFEGTDLRLRRRNMTKELGVMDGVRIALQRDLQRITAGAHRVILMVGSNRQSVYVDQFNRGRLEKEIGPLDSEVGWVRHDYHKLAEEQGWELNRALLADKENNAPPGTAWNNDGLQIRFVRGMDKHLKQNMIQYQFEQLRNIEGQIDFYFFDDNSDYLDFVRRQVHMHIPPSMRFFTVHFDWFSHIIEQKPMDLHAVDTEDRPQSLDGRRS